MPLYFARKCNRLHKKLGTLIEIGYFRQQSRFNSKMRHPEKEVTIYDIARKLNLSAATVSRGLKNNPAINQTTRKKIAAAADEMGYRFNSFASNLRRQRTDTIGVIVPRLNSNFMSEALAGMEKAASEAGY